MPTDRYATTWEYDSYPDEDDTPKQQPRPKYKVTVNGNIADIRYMLNRLFRLGYVFGPEYRFRTFEEVGTRYNVVMPQWQYIRFHHDPECKMVMGYLRDIEWNSVKREYITIELDKFLYEIAGHKRPENNLIVTVDEFNKEFEDYQKKTATIESLTQMAREEGIVQYTGEQVQASVDNISPSPTEERVPPAPEPTAIDVTQEVVNRRYLRTLRQRILRTHQCDDDEI